jgi:hypothetical protein
MQEKDGDQGGAGMEKLAKKKRGRRIPDGRRQQNEDRPENDGAPVVDELANDDLIAAAVKNDPHEGQID